jgi:hypothetical protein
MSSFAASNAHMSAVHRQVIYMQFAVVRLGYVGIADIGTMAGQGPSR